jgi:hypothetical protein
VADRGFTSKENRRHLTAGGDGYILGEKLRSGSPEAVAAMARQGRYQDVTANLQVKEVKISESERFVIDKLELMIAGTDRLTPTKRAEVRGVISTKPGLNRILRVTPGGLLRGRRRQGHRRCQARREVPVAHQRPALSTEDIALGYKQLLEVERGQRDMKQVLHLRPVYHRLEDRIRAHVVLCWLALLLARIVETRAKRDPPVAAGTGEPLSLPTAVLQQTPTSYLDRSHRTNAIKEMRSMSSNEDQFAALTRQSQEALTNLARAWTESMQGMAWSFTGRSVEAG